MFNPGGLGALILWVLLDVPVVPNGKGRGATGQEKDPPIGLGVNGVFGRAR